MYNILYIVLGRYDIVLDHLAVRDVAQGTPLGGGSTLHPKITQIHIRETSYHSIKLHLKQVF